MHDVSGAFSSKTLKVLLALLDPPNDFLARELEKALSNLVTDDEVVSEVISIHNFFSRFVHILETGFIHFCPSSHTGRNWMDEIKMRQIQ